MANITNVTCSYGGATLTVLVSWDTLDTGTPTVYDASGQAVAGTITSSGPGYANWQPNAGAMTAGMPYWAQVVIAQVPSLKIPLLWTAPTNVVSSFDGLNVLLSWTAPIGVPTPGSYTISITDGDEIQVVISSATKVAFSPSLSLTIGDNWSVTVVPTLGVSTGPSVAGSVVSASFAVSQVACTALSATTGQIAITPATTSSTSFIATLRQNRVSVLSQQLTYTPGTPMNLPVPAANWPLSPAGGYTIAIQPVSGAATGPQGASLPVIVTAPVITQATVNGGASPTVVIDVALPPGLPQASGFSATIMNGATNAGRGTFNGPSGTVPLSAAIAAGTYVLTVAALAGPNSTGPVATVNLVTSSPAVTEIDADAGLVTVTFTGAASIALSQIDIAVSGTIVTSAQTLASSITLPAPSAPFTVSVRGAAPGLLGPVVGPVTAIATAPSGQGVSYVIAGGAPTLTWTALSAPAGGYTVETYDGNKQNGSAPVTGVGTTSAPLPTGGLLTGGAITATVRGTGTDATTNAKLSGPRSQAVPVITNAPGSVGTSYDGATAEIWWTPPASGQVDGYLVTLTDSAGGVATATQRVATTSLTLPYASKPASVVTVGVQATGGNALGPATTAPLFTPAMFPSTNNQNAAYVAPSASLNFGKQPLAVYLPAILTAPTSSLPTNTSFTLATTQTSPWTYLLTVNQSDAVWTFDASAIRSALYADISDFMTKMTAQGLTAQGDLLLRQVFARILPMTFVETLFYAYNFNVADGGAGQGQGLVDLTPGMALRVEVESYESLPASAQSGNAGMVGNAVFDYDIGSYRSAGTWRQGFDAFLSRLVGHGVIFPGPSGGITSPLQTGAGGSPDFYYPNFLQPYYRLIFPPTYMSSVDVPVSQNLRNNVTLIAAATRTDLDTATNVLRTPSGNYQPVNAVYFRGRTLISPRIHVLLNGLDLNVPLGTTVANLLDRYAALNAAGGRAGQLSQYRAVDGVAIEGWPATRSVPVRINWTGGCTWGDGTTWLDLPLLHGDRIDVDLG